MLVGLIHNIQTGMNLGRGELFCSDIYNIYIYIYISVVWACHKKKRVQSWLHSLKAGGHYISIKDASNFIEIKKMYM